MVLKPFASTQRLKAAWCGNTACQSHNTRTKIQASSTLNTWKSQQNTTFQVLFPQRAEIINILKRKEKTPNLSLWKLESRGQMGGNNGYIKNEFKQNQGEKSQPYTVQQNKTSLPFSYITCTFGNISQSHQHTYLQNLKHFGFCVIHLTFTNSVQLCFWAENSLKSCKEAAAAGAVAVA